MTAPHNRAITGTPGVETLARVLRAVGVETGYTGADTYRKVVAERILADPGPLLEALAEAGVLRKAEAERTDTPPLAYCAGCGKPQPEHEHQWRTYWHHDACDCGATRRQHDEDCHKCDEVEKSARQAAARALREAAERAEDARREGSG